MLRETLAWFWLSLHPICVLYCPVSYPMVGRPAGERSCSSGNLSNQVGGEMATKRGYIQVLPLRRRARVAVSASSL